MFVPFLTLKELFRITVHCLFLILKKKHARRIKRLHYHDNDHNYSIYSKELLVKLNKL